MLPAPARIDERECFVSVAQKRSELDVTELEVLLVVNDPVADRE